MEKISESAYKVISTICRKKGQIPAKFRASDLTQMRCAGHSKTNTITPLLRELTEKGLLKEEEYSWGSFKYSLLDRASDFLRSLPFKKEPEEAEETFTEDDLSEDYHLELEDEIRKYKRFVITTAVVDKPANDNFLNSISNYAKRNNALVLILPSDIHNKKEGSDDKALNLDPKLKQFRVVCKDLYLNKNLCVCSIKTSAKQIKTLTGLDRIATKKDASIIVASTKQFEESVPTQKGKIPLRVVTTGAITTNNYDTDRYMSKRTAYLAEEDHMYGAVVVELAENDRFHMRIVEGSKDNTFTDLGVEYNPNGSVLYLRDNVYVMGDSHTDKLNKKLHKCIMKMIDRMCIDTVVLHDVFNATSISHHDKGKNLTKAIKAQEDKISLDKEGEGLKDYLEDISKHVRNVTIVNSNHDRHLETYLEEGRYINDPINTYTAHKLAIAYMDKKNPLKYLLESILGLNGKYLKWLDQDEDYSRYGVILNAHGDAGANGGKGSIVTFEKALGNCVTAHTHSAKRLRKACCVGVVGELDQGYNKGLTTWTHAVCIVYSNGTKQLIHFIPDKNGNYTYTI